MKVFHGPINTAGIAGILSQAERSLGVHSLSFCLPTRVLDYRSDRVVKDIGPHHLLARAELLKFLLLEAWQFDIFHFYFGQSLTLNQLWDVPFLSSLGKSIFFYFHGCDIRDSKSIISRYELNACREHWPMECNPYRRKTIDTVLEYARGIFVSTPDLLEFIPGSRWLPQPINLDLFSWENNEDFGKDNINKSVVKIAHAPSNRMIKGTTYLEKAIKRLQDDHYPVELMIVENIPHDSALAIYRNADIVVDQLLIGTYGQFAIEMMALGKPVICYIRENVRGIYPKDLPIISSTPANIVSVLKQLVSNREAWAEFGLRGRDYVSRVHDSKVVAQSTIQAYRRN